jgi:hypothetical protein
MAPKVIIKTLSCEQMYRNLIRMHLPGHTSSSNWNTTDLAVVTAHHEKFLCEVGKTGCSIKANMLAKCLHEHFNCMGCRTAFKCRNFANQLADALAFCRANGKPTKKKGTSNRILTGVITPNTASAVKAVISAINGSMLLMASSAEGEAVKDANTPSMRSPLAPGDMVGDAAAALQGLQEAFGEGQGSATACSSTSPHA